MEPEASNWSATLVPILLPTLQWLFNAIIFILSFTVPIMLGFCTAVAFECHCHYWQYLRLPQPKPAVPYGIVPGTCHLLITIIGHIWQWDRLRFPLVVLLSIGTITMCTCIYIAMMFELDVQKLRKNPRKRCVPSCGEMVTSEENEDSNIKLEMYRTRCTTCDIVEEFDGDGEKMSAVIDLIEDFLKECDD